MKQELLHTLVALMTHTEVSRTEVDLFSQVSKKRDPHLDLGTE